ncbi:MAG: TetR/AcrR family transcriptional regulator [Thermomicrobiales bacterium]
MAHQLKQDRRSRRSQRLIVEALLALMREKRYDRITVQEIIDQADVGRSTFYAQFRNKEDVLVSEVERVLGLLHEQHLAPADDPADHLLPSAGFFRHVQETQSLYPALVRGLAIDPHYQAVHRYLRDQAAQQLALAAGSRDLAVPPEIVADYLAGALLTLVHWWLDHGLRYTPEQMEAIFQQLVMPGVRAVLPNRHQ